MIADMIKIAQIFMVCCERRPIVRVCAAIVVLAGFSGMILMPSISLAQYPGSAGDLNTGAFGASSSASTGSSSSSTSSSGSGSSDVPSDGSASGLIKGSGSNSDGANGRDSYEGRTAAALPREKSVRKRALIRQFRLEFAKTLTIETASKRPLRASSADVFLNQFSNELDAGLSQQADLSSLSRDLGLLRDTLNDSIDEVIDSYGGDAPRRGFFSKTASAGESASALRTEIQKLKLKHELLEFGEYSLQAMGYYVK